MESQFSDIELFKGRNLSDIFHEIYDNHVGKKNQIRSLIAQLTPLVDGIGDATLLVPLIKEYMELGIKNDEQLVKLAQIVQRMDVPKKSDGFDFGDLQNLLDQDQEIEQQIQETQEEPKKLINSECPTQ